MCVYNFFSHLNQCDEASTESNVLIADDSKSLSAQRSPIRRHSVLWNMQIVYLFQIEKTNKDNKA